MERKVLVVVLSKELNPEPDIRVDVEETRRRLEKAFQGWTVEAVRAEKV